MSPWSIAVKAALMLAAASGVGELQLEVADDTPFQTRPKAADDAPLQSSPPSLASMNARASMLIRRADFGEKELPASLEQEVTHDSAMAAPTLQHLGLATSNFTVYLGKSIHHDNKCEFVPHQIWCAAEKLQGIHAFRIDLTHNSSGTLACAHHINYFGAGTNSAGPWDFPIQLHCNKVTYALHKHPASCLAHYEVHDVSTVAECAAACAQTHRCLKFSAGAHVQGYTGSATRGCNQGCRISLCNSNHNASDPYDVCHVDKQCTETLDIGCAMYVLESPPVPDMRNEQLAMLHLSFR